MVYDREFDNLVLAARGCDLLGNTQAVIHIGNYLPALLQRLQDRCVQMKWGTLQKLQWRGASVHEAFSFHLMTGMSPSWTHWHKARCKNE